MTNNKLRVIFDTNAFTPENFELLEKGPLIQLCKMGRIRPIYSHVFLEETFRAYGHHIKRDDLVKRWIPLITATADRFCDDFLTIWHRELVQARGIHTNIYLKPRAQRRLIESLAHIPLDGTWTAWHDSKPARDIEDQKRTAQRQISKEIRLEVATWRKKVNYSSQRHGLPDYHQYLNSELDHMGRELINSQVHCHNPIEVAYRWSRNKYAYPYFTKFVENILYIAFFAMTRQSEKIDHNAQADLDLMTHLLRADALVSNEAGFLRSAFDDLWRPKGKVIFTSQEFATFIKKL
ncbi:hypothetical protein [Chromobacterium paludis]|uniref:Uncharacterized protein n=1 Tax=Chromobacterium paludis TaxID=2605945 RepID=A0A5C1DJN2_9NEIS|nr:hypothetical protein [Chromobacterium paludis]QEL56865.1 hypothetical protein FYK34_15495 [Chromobacterium paludis]